MGCACISAAPVEVPDRQHSIDLLFARYYALCAKPRKGGNTFVVRNSRNIVIEQEIMEAQSHRKRQISEEKSAQTANIASSASHTATTSNPQRDKRSRAIQGAESAGGTCCTEAIHPPDFATIN